MPKSLRVAGIGALLAASTVACSNAVETTYDATAAPVTSTTALPTTTTAATVPLLQIVVDPGMALNAEVGGSTTTEVGGTTTIDPLGQQSTTVGVASGQSSTSTTAQAFTTTSARSNTTARANTTTTARANTTTTAQATTTTRANTSTTAQATTTAKANTSTTAQATTTTAKADTTTTAKADTPAPVSPEKSPASPGKSGKSPSDPYPEGNTSVPTDHFVTLPPGSTLPTGSWCATKVRSSGEVRKVNEEFNYVKGTKPNSVYPRVDGNFTGTTDEIIQWAACKWGIDEDIVRAQAVVESWWDQGNGGDKTTDKSKCHPAVRDRAECPESLGLLQIRWRVHPEAFEDNNALRSTAYNVDFVFGKWRACYEGRVSWLNEVERGQDYKAGDLWGCIGVWYAGRWHTNGASNYIETVKRRMNNRKWAEKDFLGYDNWVANGGER